MTMKKTLQMNFSDKALGILKSQRQHLPVLTFSLLAHDAAFSEKLIESILLKTIHAVGSPLMS